MNNNINNNSRIVKPIPVDDKKNVNNKGLTDVELLNARINQEKLEESKNLVTKVVVNKVNPRVVITLVFILIVFIVIFIVFELPELIDVINGNY